MKQGRHRQPKSTEAVKHGWPAESVQKQSMFQSLASVDWSRVFRVSFMYLFFCYPGITMTILRTFKCREVEGVWYLEADLRLQCFTGVWSSMVIYAGVMAGVFVIGFPCAVLYVLVRRKHKLFGASSESTRFQWGFLYEAYGAKAWWWEVEELVRKLFLTSIVVLLNTHQPLQIALAVLVSFSCHTLHAVYEPWGAGSQTYALQHAALLSLSFVFFVGLLFKSETISSTSQLGLALSVIMLTISVAFILSWVFVMIRAVVIGYRAEKRLSMFAARESERKQQDVMVLSNPIVGSHLPRRDSIAASRLKRVSRVQGQAVGPSVASISRIEAGMPDSNEA
jgi:hypothetical protein